MKKSKLITGLSAAFVSAMALMSCSSLVKAKSGVILTIDGVPYTAEDLFNDQKTPAAAEAKFNAVYKVAVRAYFKKNTEDNKEIERQVKVKMNEQKATAKSNADKNGTSYEVEWKKILKENGVDTTKKLQDKFEYEFQKEKFEDHFYEKNYKELRSGHLEGTGDEFVNYFTGKQPYHMKHILIKISNLGDDNVTGTITAKEADNLYKVITQLASGVPFETVSNLLNEDETAKKDHASLGIMSRDTSFVDDFKLGTYLYEAFYGRSTSDAPGTTIYEASEAKDKLNLKNGTIGDGTAAGYAKEILEKALDATTGETIGVIPYEAALMLGKKDNKEYPGYGDYEYADQPLLNDAGISKDDFKEKYLPRNVIFNKYFNKHNIMVIAPAKLANNTFNYGTDIAETTSGSYRLTNDSYTCSYDAAVYSTLDGFNQPVVKNGDYLIADKSGLQGAIAAPGAYVESNQKVLRDNEGRIILVFRSGTGGSSSNDDSGYQGIHFVVIERSPFIGKEEDDNNPTTGTKWTSLDDYYTVYYPGQPGGDHPKYDGTNEDKHTYANYIMNDPELKNKKDRADKVKSELKNCMPNLNTFIYDHLLDTGEIQFNQEMVEKYHIDIKKDIESWINITRQDSKDEKERNWNNNWQNYCYSLEAKAKMREEVTTTTVTPNRVDSLLIPEYCIAALTKETNADHISHMFGVGGAFHD